MKYEGRVYGKINGKYIELEVEKDEIVKTPKRKPLSDGTLELTSEECREFYRLFFLKVDYFKYVEVLSVLYAEDEIRVYFKTRNDKQESMFLTDVKAIIWLNDRFDLGGE
jgi:hypothetical protein